MAMSDHSDAGDAPRDHRPDADRNAESTTTVLIAGGANLAIAIAKTFAGVLSGSSAMLAEAAHSMADTLNQVFLLTALRRSDKPADAEHPFGYGMERYFWSLLAAVGIFVLGAGFSIYQGVEAILKPTEIDSLSLTYAVLAVSFLFEGTSWIRALRQTHHEAEAEGRHALAQVRSTSDPTLKTVLFEDTAALIGIVVAAAGVTLHHLTDQAFWDGGASIAIGMLLVLVAYALGRENKSMLLGQSLRAEERDAVRQAIEGCEGIDEVVELMTMRLSPDEVLVAARVDVTDDISGGDLEHFADDVDRQVRQQFPEVRHVFLDPTDAERVTSEQRTGGERER
jgi:cation diffusion facilitator family transporter